MNETQVRTWLPSEIWQLIAQEMREYRHECTLKRRPWSYDEMAELVYYSLDENGLIEHTP